MREMREAANLSQSEVAQKIRKSQSIVSMYESGERRISAELIPQLAKLYGCTIEQLFNVETDQAG